MPDLIPKESIENKLDELQREILELNKLFELNKIINDISNLDSLAEKLSIFLKIQMNSKNIAFFILEENKYKIVAYENIETPSLIEFKNSGEGIWQIIKAAQPFGVMNKKGKNIYSLFFESNKLEKLNSCIWLPFIYEGKILAIVSLGLKNTGEHYSDLELKLLKKISEHISPVINKLKTQKIKESSIKELQKTLHNISILYDIGQSMNFIDDLKKLLKMILNKAILVTSSEKGSLMLRDVYTQELLVKVVHGLADKEVEEKINEGLIECSRIKVGEGIAGNVVVSKKAIITNLGSNDPRFKYPEDSRVSSILCVPLIVKEEAIGVINITNKLNGKFFDQDDLNFMSALANQAAIAINNAQLYELAITDGLTKLYIHRHFQHLLNNEIKRSDRYQHPLSLLMMDIDNFKIINDNYGHRLGDEILKQIAQIILNTCRKIDMPSRYGGEEFAIILPETEKQNAIKIAERLRSKIQGIIVYSQDNNVPVSPTISIGVSSYPNNAKDQESLIETADKAMYSAKRKGKNCVVDFFSEEA
ncbi:MAG: diguanylate cyclase [bacterium]